jgi:hypothetical protein
MTIHRQSYYSGIGGRAVANAGLSSTAHTHHDASDWLAAAAHQSTFDLRDIAPAAWLALGESHSKCAHFIHSPMRPEWAVDLTRQQVGEAAAALLYLDDRDDATADGIASELRELEYDRVHRRSLGLTPQGIHARHARLRHGSGLSAPIALSEPTLRGLGELCDRLQGPVFRPRESLLNFALGFIRAALVHFELLRLRPFAEASGMTARVVEIGLLLEVDEISIRQAGLLSVHYASTRDRYERFATDAVLQPVDFVDYAAIGFRDALRQQLHGSRTFFPLRRAQLFQENAREAIANGH